MAEVTCGETDRNLPYAAGLALTHGRIEIEHYADPTLHDARLLDLVRRIKVVPPDAAGRMKREFNLCGLEIVLTFGARQPVRVEYHRGHFQNPMSDAETEDKFRSPAVQRLPAERADNLLRLLWRLDTLPPTAALIAATRA